MLRPLRLATSHLDWIAKRQVHVGKTSERDLALQSSSATCDSVKGQERG